MKFNNNSIPYLKKVYNPIAIPEKVFGDLWFKGEVSILFSDSNLGKSTLANDIVIGVQQKEWDFFDEKSESCTIKDRLNIAYYDFEMSDKQYMAKFKDMPEVDFKRTTFDYTNPECSFSSESIIANMESEIQAECHNVFVIDNLSVIESMGRSFDKTRKFLYQLKRIVTMTENTSILLLAHTVKRNLEKPITQNDLLGSKAIINFCDSAFALGGSVKGEDIRYIKQIKSRMARKHDDVAEIRLSSSPYPHFEFVAWNSEDEHLKKSSSKNGKIDENQLSEIRMLHRLGRSIREIADYTGISKSTVHRLISKYKEVNATDEKTGQWDSGTMGTDVTDRILGQIIN